jgi:hypothetical protein
MGKQSTTYDISVTTFSTVYCLHINDVFGHFLETFYAALFELVFF